MEKTHRCKLVHCWGIQQSSCKLCAMGKHDLKFQLVVASKEEQTRVNDVLICDQNKGGFSTVSYFVLHGLFCKGGIITL